MTAGVILTIRCDDTTGGVERGQQWYSPVTMPHHRALRAYLRGRGATE